MPAAWAMEKDDDFTPSSFSVSVQMPDY